MTYKFKPGDRVRVMKFDKAFLVDSEHVCREDLTVMGESEDYWNRYLVGNPVFTVLEQYRDYVKPRYLIHCPSPELYWSMPEEFLIQAGDMADIEILF